MREEEGRGRREGGREGGREERGREGGMKTVIFASLTKTKP